MIRRATMDDLQRVYDWRNRPEIVADSTHGHYVSWQEHSRWFAHAIQGIDVLLYVIEPDAGCLRFDLESYDEDAEEAVISVYLLPEYRGKGLGVCSIYEGTREAFRYWPINKVVANIRKGNRVSRHAFRKAGYVREWGGELPSHIRMVAL